MEKQQHIISLKDTFKIKMQPHKKVNSLDYLRGDRKIKDIKIERKLKIDEVFIVEEKE